MSVGILLLSFSLFRSCLFPPASLSYQVGEKPTPICLRPLGSARSLAQVRESLGELAELLPPANPGKTRTLPRTLLTGLRSVAGLPLLREWSGAEGYSSTCKGSKISCGAAATRGSRPCPQLGNRTACSFAERAPPENRNPWVASPKSGGRPPRGLCKGAAERTQSGHVERGRPKPLADGPQFPLTSELPCGAVWCRRGAAAWPAQTGDSDRSLGRRTPPRILQTVR